MARCYQLTPQQSQQWEEGSWPSLALEDEIFEWAYRLNIHEPIIVVTSDKRIAFAVLGEARHA
jgi:hypothetical protein